MSRWLRWTDKEYRMLFIYRQVHSPRPSENKAFGLHGSSSSWLPMCRFVVRRWFMGQSQFRQLTFTNFGAVLTADRRALLISNHQGRRCGSMIYAGSIYSESPYKYESHVCLSWTHLKLLLIVISLSKLQLCLNAEMLKPLEICLNAQSRHRILAFCLTVFAHPATPDFVPVLTVPAFTGARSVGMVGGSSVVRFSEWYTKLLWV